MDFAVCAEVDGQSKALVVTDLTFERLIDEIVVSYHRDDAFFVDGVPVKRQQVRRLIVVHQGPSFPTRRLSDISSCRMVQLSGKGGDCEGARRRRYVPSVKGL